MNTPILSKLETDIQQLTLEEQIWLLERLAHHIGEQAMQQQTLESQLEAMASDPDIQREIRAIEDEFSATDADGLTDLQ